MRGSLMNENLYYVYNAQYIRKKDTNKQGIRLFFSKRDELGTMLDSYNKCHGFENLCKLLYSNGYKIKVVDYFGILPKELCNITLQLTDSQISSNKIFEKVQIRSKEKFYPILKTFLCSFNLNPIILSNNFVYDNPFVVLNGKFCCLFRSRLSDSLNSSQVSFEDGIISYVSKKLIYLLVEDSKRHIPAELEESLFINFKTGKITCRLAYIEDDGVSYIKSSEYFDTSQNVWKVLNQSKCSILGFKYARS